MEDLLRKSRIRSIESKITCTAASVVNAHIVVATQNSDVIFVESSTRLSKGFPYVRDRVRSSLVANEAIHEAVMALTSSFVHDPLTHNPPPRPSS